MNIERLNELKAIVLADISAEYDCDDLTDILNREIHRIESRRKVPLQPCKCGHKPERWKGPDYWVKYKCPNCGDAVTEDSDREARLAWNEKMRKDGAENG